VLKLVQPLLHLDMMILWHVSTDRDAVDAADKVTEL
jgi:hypothetical protein